METKQSFSTSEVAKYCHVTADTIRKWAEAGRIRVFKTPGGHRRIRHEDLIQFLRDNRIPIHPDLSGAGARALVIANEHSVLTVIRRSLERTQPSCRVEVASDSFDAGRQIAGFRPDVVFLDLRMAGMDSVDICRRIKSAPELAGIHVVVMGTSDDTRVAENAMREGASAQLTKPFTPDDLRRVLARVGIETN
jgi:excisionase family DNA binding protein